jgi:hypothetical protein
MGIEMSWTDANRTLGLRLAEGSKVLPPLHRRIELKLGETSRTAQFDGSPLEVKL